ncbi:MAG: SDR family NAD(P)-dependent oxidoreductase [Nitrospirae bacterium]|nr:SDR family NAD(P)-dependent oxidoreductase [Nitrospirota bacterium]
MDDLTGRVALVTGGASGIGLAVARGFLAAGLKVAIAGRRRGRLNEAAASLRAAPGGEVLAVPADVAERDQVDALVQAVVDRFGALDVLVNNAGIGLFGNVAESDPADWQRVLAVNTTGPYLCARAAWPHLAARGGGHVIHIASLSGKEGFAGASAYCASKFGLMGLSEVLRAEGEAAGIKVTAICPGYVDTPMVAGVGVPAEVMIRPEDVAATCLYLLRLSPYASVPEVVIRRAGAG